MSQQLNTLLRDKAWARWTALILLAAAMFFAYIFVDILSPLQASLQSLKGWIRDVPECIRILFDFCRCHT